jgi:bacterioferritin-associated ferredoxin
MIWYAVVSTDQGGRRVGIDQWAETGTEPMGVQRCICSHVTLDEVVRRAQAGQNFEQICSDTGCCQGCGMCRPYVHLAIETGRTQLPILSPAQAEAVLNRAQARQRREESQATEDSAN